MKRILLSISIGLATTVSTAFGWSGGPFSNDSPLDTGGAGTYQGIASGDNLLGITIFGYSEVLGSTGRWVFFHEGVVSTGNVQSVVDFPGRQIVGIMGGDAIEGQTKASGAFEAHINSTKPLVTATGTGEFTSPALPQDNTTVTITDTATDTTTVGDSSDNQSKETREVVTTSTTVLPVRETVPFDISLTRTSVRVGSFTSSGQ